jgi:hypothetical protein
MPASWPARCAILLPVLAAVPQPFGLLEVDASAVLTLPPDRYSHDYLGRCITADPRCSGSGLPTARSGLTSRSPEVLLSRAEPSVITWRSVRSCRRTPAHG